MKTAVFGGGCFWCTEAVFAMLKGVTKVEPGYAGGEMDNPTYERVSAGNTGHAEVIRVTYDPAVISYEDLLTVFFGSHDPTTPNRQGADVGEQYRSVIFYDSDDEKELKKVQRAFFVHVYNLLIGEDTGPRLGTFLWAVDRAKVITLLSL